AIISAKLLQRIVSTPKPTVIITTDEIPSEKMSAYPTWVSFLALIGFISLIPITLIWGRQFSPWIIPTLIITIISYGMLKGLDVYASFIEGAKGGFELAVKII
ncbi:MAG TPA: hypothetical protein PLD88_09335, partial [Candidatus Berkiella sp.]|nr:hypothetical protein [Candidatus Berkiella sp.]